ncbi:MAG: hypothetical protein QF570_21795 [Myxococcota bacterium]|nr:hypothetical protein [Myxococcota bacterium]
MVIGFVSWTTTAHAATIHNTFAGSSTGTAGGLVEHDTIQFEVTITTTAGRNYNTIFWSLSGDRDNALGGCADCLHPAHTVTRWDWHYTPAGGSRVKMGTNGRLPALLPPAAPPNSVVGAFGFFGTAKTGDGVPAMVGTVTIAIGPRATGGLGGGGAALPGVYRGGGIQYPGVDGFFGSAGTESVTITGGSFTVVPEPGTSAMIALGLVLIAHGTHRSRRG